MRVSTLTIRFVVPENGSPLRPDLRFAWTAPDCEPAGVMISFEADDRRARDAQRVLVVPTDAADPEAAARQVLERLGEIPPREWVDRYGWRPGN